MICACPPPIKRGGKHIDANRDKNGRTSVSYKKKVLKSPLLNFRTTYTTYRYRFIVEKECCLL